MYFRNTKYFRTHSKNMNLFLLHFIFCLSNGNTIVMLLTVQSKDNLQLGNLLAERVMNKYRNRYINK